MKENQEQKKKLEIDPELLIYGTLTGAVIFGGIGYLIGCKKGFNVASERFEGYLNDSLCSLTLATESGMVLPMYMKKDDIDSLGGVVTVMSELVKKGGN